MRSEQSVREKMDELIKQRDVCERGSAARKTLNQRVYALAWVLEREEIEDLVIDEEVRKLLDCVS